jgi:hypothetical protein
MAAVMAPMSSGEAVETRTTRVTAPAPSVLAATQELMKATPLNPKLALDCRPKPVLPSATLS